MNTDRGKRIPYPWMINQEVLALKGPQTQLLDVQGRTVIPGFLDAHGHGKWFATGGGGGNTNDPRNVRAGNLKCPTLDKCVEEIRVQVAKAKPGQWLRFGGGVRTDLKSRWM